jgi:hypothetical protein
MLKNLFRFVGFTTLATASLAFAQTQASQQQTINAGVVVLENSGQPGFFGGQPMNAAPYAWFNLQSDTSVKPAGWNFQNPNGPSILTPEMQTRWNLITGTTIQPGQKLTKQNAAYWEVFLSKLSENSLARYDVLLICPQVYATMTPNERERLRKFVDGGGLLWIDAGALTATNQGIGGMDWLNTWPLAFRIGSNNGAQERNDYTAPILTSPQPISPGEITLLNSPVGGTWDLEASNLESNVYGGLTSQFLEYKPVTRINNGSTMSVAHIGDGVIVATARGAAVKLNRVATSPAGAYTDNQAFLGKNPGLDYQGRAAAKLAVNMISLLTQYRQDAGGSRKVSSSSVNLGAPLLLRSLGSGAVSGAPTVYKGLIIAAIGNEIVAYDADPARDLDGDGDPDDGIPDYNIAGSEDVVWRTTAPNAPFSSPVCTDVPASQVATSQAIVINGQGNMVIINAAPMVNGVYLKAQQNLVVATVNPGGNNNNPTPVAPTIHEGLAYVCDRTNTNPSRGRVWVANLYTGTLMASDNGNWILGGSGPSNVQLPPFTQSATVGYIPIFDNSGGSDKVLYAPFQSSSNGVPSAGFSSVWLGAKGEKPSEYGPKFGDDPETSLTITTRAAQQGGLPVFLPSSPSQFAVKIVFLDANGKPFNKNLTDNILGPNPAITQDGGVLSIPFPGGAGTLPASVKGLRVDYVLDLGNDPDNADQLSSGVERGRVNLPDVAGNPKRVVTGPIALAPNGNFFLNAQDPTVDASPFGTAGTNRGAVFGFREEGRGLFRLLLRYEMYGQHTITLNGGSPVTYAPTFFDYDPFKDLVSATTGGNINFLGTLDAFRIVGSPVVRNDQVLVTVSCNEALKIGALTLPVGSTVVMAFKSDPDVPQVNIGELPEGSTLIQYDIARSTSGTRPEVASTLAGANFNYNGETGVLRFNNLSAVQKGVIQQSFSLSQPFIVRRPGQPDRLVDPNTAGGNTWNPLQWYTVIPAFDCKQSAPSTSRGGGMASGDTLYIPGSSYTPAILSGIGFQPTGMIYGIQTKISSGNSYLQPSPLRPWQRQLFQFKTGSYEANPAFMWPLSRGVTSFDSYVVRMRQAILSARGLSSPLAYGVAGGDGALVAWGNQGLYTFTKTDFLIADQGRIAEFDPAGNLTWTTTASGSGGTVGNITTGTVQPLVRPTRAYRLADKSVLTVDTGSNRIAVVNPVGVETRTLQNFLLDDNHVPNGYTANESLSLNAPRDVAIYTSYESWPNIQNLVTRGDGNVTNEYWVHYLIADSGNQRLIELVDRYRFNANLGVLQGPVTVTNASGQAIPQIGMLVWHSPANFSGKQFSYNSISRIWVPQGAGGRYVYVAGIGGGLPTRVDSGLDNPSSGLRQSADGKGGIVIFDPADQRGVRVINQIDLPAVDANVFWNDATASFNSAARPQQSKIIGNISSVTTRLIPGSGGGSIAIMITEPSGVYEMTYSLTTDPGDTLPASWWLPAEVYRTLRILPVAGSQPLASNVPLNATFARRLDNGDVLLVNGFFGRNRGGQEVKGEVLQIDASLSLTNPVSAPNFGFNLLSLTYELPPVTGARELVIPVFADRR